MRNRTVPFPEPPERKSGQRGSYQNIKSDQEKVHAVFLKRTLFHSLGHTLPLIQTFLAGEEAFSLPFGFGGPERGTFLFFTLGVHLVPSPLQLL
jgi:hypothetical protein